MSRQALLQDKGSEAPELDPDSAHVVLPPYGAPALDLPATSMQCCPPAEASMTWEPGPVSETSHGQSAIEREFADLVLLQVLGDYLRRRFHLGLVPQSELSDETLSP